MKRFLQYLSEAKQKAPELKTFKHGSFWYHPKLGKFHSWSDIGGEGGFWTHARDIMMNPSQYGLQRNSQKHRDVVALAKEGDYSHLFDKGWVRGFVRNKSVILHGRHLPSIVSAVRSHSSNPHNVEHTYSIALEKPNFTTTDYSLRTPTHVDRFLSSRGAPHRDYIIRYV